MTFKCVECGDPVSYTVDICQRCRKTRERIQNAISTERERCALIAEHHVDDENLTGYVIAKAIRNPE